MKTTNIIIISFLAAALTLVSCKKDNTEPEPIPQKDLIRTITTDSYTAEFVYNEADWSVSRIDMQYHMDGISSTGTINFIWNYDRLTIENINGDYIINYSFAVENGRATAMFFDGQETPAATFGYDTEGYLSHITWTHGYKDTYTWENGNMTAVSGTLNAEIGYGNIVNNTNLDFIYLISPGYLSQISYPYGSLIGLLGTSPAKMPESETCYIEGYDAIDISYSYTLDDEGRITSININNNGAESTVSIKY
ncbi:MAG TPA: DUF4595 domain-containing protein [Candidatus Coprenecus merdipullorum]|nr:DUF4595 domain-containing protein [Candidatus Coprenecus merdipullorum]